ncbi:hypothetical protein ACH5RR_037283 [Cinchona calisaya]|uniref:Uncharacterized protein n=1 Tax=Cinchona calisaya TaxID=153742 RepID=A0ABD2YA07_9GENT
MKRAIGSGGKEEKQGYCGERTKKRGSREEEAGERGSVAPRTRIAPEVRYAILGSLKEYAQKVKEKRGDFGEENPFGRSVDDFDGMMFKKFLLLKPKEFQ